MTDLDGSLLRKLAEWDAGGAPVTSLLLSVDGRRLPRRADVEIRLEELARGARAQLEGLERDAVTSVERDLSAMAEFVREEFDRADTRGLAMFSSTAAGLWEVVAVPRPLRDRAVVGPGPHLLPLEVLLETYRPTCLALIDHADARLFVIELGRIEEVADVSDEVPGRHDQGGRAQMRMQRHVDDHRARHVRRVADALFALSRRRRFEHLLLAGPGEAHLELEAGLHDYLRRRVRRHATLPMTATSRQVLERVDAFEEEIEREAEALAVARLAGAVGADRGVAGLEDCLPALSEGRVGELVVDLRLSAPGARCDSCGRLALSEATCPSCGGPMRGLADVAEAAVAQAFRSGARVETVEQEDALQPFGGIGAVLRY